MASTNQGIKSEDIPDFKLPPKILCRVLSVMLKVKTLNYNNSFFFPPTMNLFFFLTCLDVYRLSMTQMKFTLRSH